MDDLGLTVLFRSILVISERGRVIMKERVQENPLTIGKITTSSRAR